MDKPPSLGAKLRTLRRQRDLSQDEVADAVGISRSFLAGIENDHDKPGYESFVALADYYGVSLDWLAKGDQSPKSDPAQELGALRQILRFFYEGPARESARQLARQMLAEMDVEEVPVPRENPQKGGQDTSISAKTPTKRLATKRAAR